MPRITQLTFTYFCPPNRFKESLFPRLRLQGLWLEELGWEIGSRVSVEANEAEIVIRKLPAQTFSKV